MFSLASGMLRLASGMTSFSSETPRPPVAQVRPPGKQQEIVKEKERARERERGRPPKKRKQKRAREREKVEGAHSATRGRANI